jgi:hypothetical protein
LGDCLTISGGSLSLAPVSQLGTFGKGQLTILPSSERLSFVGTSHTVNWSGFIVACFENSTIIAFSGHLLYSYRRFGIVHKVTTHSFCLRAFWDRI